MLWGRCRYGVPVFVAVTLGLISTCAIAEAQQGLNIGEKDSVYIDATTFKVIPGKAKGDVASQIKTWGARDLGPRAIIFRSGDKLEHSRCGRLIGSSLRSDHPRPGHMTQASAAMPTIRPSAARRMIRPSAARHMTQASAAMPTIRPSAARRMIRPSAARRMIRPSAARRMIQASAAMPTIRPSAARRMTEASAAMPTIRPSAARRITKASAAMLTIRPSAARHMTQASGVMHTNQAIHAMSTSQIQITWRTALKSCSRRIGPRSARIEILSRGVTI